MKAERARAGLLRRGFSFFVDGILVFIPFQALAAILFVLTAGAVQFDRGVTFTQCVKATNLPADLKPAPPADANSAQICKTFFFGLETARQLTIVRVTKDGKETSTESRNYILNRNDKVIDGWSLDGPAWVALLAYLIWGKLRKGGTIGDRTNKIVLVDDSLKTTSPPNIQQIAIRYLALLGPMLLATLAITVVSRLPGALETRITAQDWVWLFAFAIPALLYYLVCGVQIMLKRDPVWDRVARTAVIVKT